MRIVFLYVLLPLILLLIGFYWWASGSQLAAEDLHQEIVKSESVTAPDSVFSIMTYNIGYLSGMTNNLPIKPPPDLFHSNLDRAIALMNQLQPDIIGFQEIDYNSSRSYNIDQLDLLSEGFQYVVKSVNWDKNYVPFPYWPPTVHFGSMQSGQAVLSRFPITRSERKVLSGPESAPFYYRAFYLDRLLQEVQVEINQRKVMVLNVHLEAFDTETREIQASELMQVVEQYASKMPLILIGDFNARPPYATETVTSEQSVAMFLDHPLLSPALSKHDYLSSEEANFTFDTESPYEKLDYIFYTHQTIEALEVATITQAGDISDHYPVIMRFKLTDD